MASALTVTTTGAIAGQDFRGDRHDRNGSGGGEHRYRDDRRPNGNGNEGQASRVTVDFAVATATRVLTAPIAIHPAAAFNHRSINSLHSSL